MNVLLEFRQFLRILDQKAMILLFHFLIFLTNLRARRSEPLSRFLAWPPSIEVFGAVYNYAGIVGLSKGFRNPKDLRIFYLIL